MNGVPFLLFVNNRTFGMETSSLTKVLMLLFVISIDLSEIYLAIFFFKLNWSKPFEISRSMTGTGNGGYILIVGVSLTPSLSQIDLKS